MQDGLLRVPSFRSLLQKDIISTGRADFAPTSFSKKETSNYVEFLNHKEAAAARGHQAPPSTGSLSPPTPCSAVHETSLSSRNASVTVGGGDGIKGHIAALEKGRQMLHFPHTLAFDSVIVASAF